MAKDRCIICGVETAYDFETHVDMRIGYIEGAGQLCTKCYSRDHNDIAYTYNPKKIVIVDGDIILNTPNDFELGGKIRQMYYENNS